MTTLKLLGEPKTTTSRWLDKYFRGQAVLADFVKHFSENYKTSKGTRVPPKNVYSRIGRDEKRGLVERGRD